MSTRGLTLFVLFSLALPAGANYDAEELKRLITEQQSLFQITEWNGNDQDERWSASSAIKWLSVEINAQMTEVGSPYFSPPQRTAAQERCKAIASLALRLETNEHMKAIENVLTKATQHHQNYSFELNNVRFEAIPRLNGAFVRLFCSVRPLVN